HQWWTAATLDRHARASGNPESFHERHWVPASAGTTIFFHFPDPIDMQFWIVQTLNSLALGGLLFLLAAGFSLIFGLMRIANLTHGSLFMLVAYLGVTILKVVPNLWLAALLGGLVVAAFGGLVERFILRPLAGNALGQVLVTLGISFIVADTCLIVWGGDPIPVPTPPALQQPILVGGVAFPTYRLVVLAIAVATALALYLL